MHTASRVLLVEDNVALAENVSEILEDLGVEVRVALDANSALAGAKKHDFDVALVDVGLPGLSGVELVPSLRQACPDSETILVTGQGTLESAIAAVRLGAFAYLLKPVDPGALLGVVERALAQVSLRRERAALSRALSESEALYRGVVENVDALIVSLDPEGRVLFANRSAYEALGGATEPQGRRFAEVFGDNGIDLRAMVRERQCVLRRADGARRTIRWTFTPVEQEGEVARIAIGVDVTETLELRRRSAEAEALAAIGTLTAGLAHEIRNPLNAASLQLQLLRRRAAKVDDEALRVKLSEPVELVLVELGRLTTMLDDFLGLARPEEVEPERFELRALVHEVARLQAPVCAAHGLSLEERVDDGLFVNGYRYRLQQVLVNLVVNAREAMLGHGGERIVVAAYRDAEQVTIEVHNEGPGLPSGAPDPFIPFATTKAAGTGLGLAIARKIVRMHGGDLTLQNGPNGGVVARVTLASS